MVGVAGGSRGCANCKRRKVKCDETFPKCLRCIKSKLECGGPVIGPVFRKQRVGDHCDNSISAVTRKAAQALDPDPVSRRLRNLLMTDDETRISAYERELRSRTGPSVLFKQSVQNQLRAFSSTPIPRELVLFPEYDLYHYCTNIFLDKFSVIGQPQRFGEFKKGNLWVEMLPQFVLSPVPSSTTFASRALIISHCSAVYRDADFALLAANWYVQALKYQKELVSMITADRENYFPVSDAVSIHKIALVEEDSSSLSSVQSPCTSGSTPTSSYDDLIKWSQSETPPAPRLSKQTALLPENSSMPLDIPVLATGQNVSSMRGNVMSFQDDSITAGMLLAIYEVLNCGSDSSWIKLLSGVYELLRLRGPEAYRTGFNSTLFQSIRGMMAVHGLVTRKKTVFNDTEWKTIPWELSPSDKLINHYLFDLVLEVPEYQEITDRLIMYSFTNDEVDPDDDLGYSSNLSKRTPRLRKRYHNRETWAELRETHEKLLDLDARLDKWWDEYSDSVREYARESLHFSPTVTFDPATGAPDVAQPRCPATTSDSEFFATHFFRPAVKYVTLRDSLLVVVYLATRMVVAYLLQLTVCFKYVDFDDSLCPNPMQSDPDVRAYIENKTGYMRDLANIICRSTNYIIVRSSNLAILNLLFPLRIAHSVVQDTLERGWIWNELRRMHDLGVRLSLADLHGANEDKHVDEWKKFKSLDVCAGCGEHVRPLMRCVIEGDGPNMDGRHLDTLLGV
ncbi:hypothetical protein V1525DRAFT_388931 [Lipomyces kononenkoae]|uniref:Uncharacterized protein n=1 Tax=Lipomyces kononenkoae TaxID=34357 RepID=A0ACC3SZZ9_LIPKO